MSKRIYVKIKTTFEGYHQWKNAPEDIAFLRSLHRHLFYLTATIEVTDDDRQIEFFQCKRYVDSLTKPMLKKLGTTVSCEQMADYIRKELHKKYGNHYVKVEVSEDNENGSIVEDKKE